ncbi:MAG: exo-beta-N-acetylmuramidase NamZ family protein [Gemmatimonadaceae bacterium]
MMRAVSLLAPLVALAAPAIHAQQVAVIPGVEQFLGDVPAAIRGKRVGLITNHTGVDSRGASIIDRLATSRDVRLVALFGPEHGIRGTAADGVKISSSRDAKTGLPIFSLYGETRKPTPRMLAGIDALLFDMQDVGARPYTYVSTMALAMQAAESRGIPFVVLDRPNPIGGHIVEGNVLDTAFKSFTGIYPIASRHGMTIGELARMFNERFGIGANLIVIPMDGWEREMWFDETGLPWISPSPNIRRLETAIHYPGTVFVEATNLSEGRGSDIPLEQAGAPWLRAREVADSMNAMRLPGVRFEAVRFTTTPHAAKYGGRTLPGVRFVLTDRERYRPVRTALLLIDLVRRLHPNEFRWTERGAGFDRLAGTDKLRKAMERGAFAAALDDWEREAEAFEQARRRFLLY